MGRRLRRLSEILARELEVIQLGSEIQSQVESEIGKGQREYYLREQLKAIQAELGESDPRAGGGGGAAPADRGGRACPSMPASRPIASWAGSSGCRRPPPSTA